MLTSLFLFIIALTEQHVGGSEVWETPTTVAPHEGHHGHNTENHVDLTGIPHYALKTDESCPNSAPNATAVKEMYAPHRELAAKFIGAKAGVCAYDLLMLSHISIFESYDLYLLLYVMLGRHCFIRWRS